MTQGRNWIKLYTDMLSDPKVGKLSLRAFKAFIFALLLAGCHDDTDADGRLTGYVGTAADLAHVLRRCARAVETDLAEIGDVMERREDRLYVVHFAERQGQPMSQRRDQWREATHKHRSLSTTEPIVAETLSEQCPGLDIDYTKAAEFLSLYEATTRPIPIKERGYWLRELQKFDLADAVTAFTAFRENWGPKNNTLPRLLDVMRGLKNALYTVRADGKRGK